MPTLTMASGARLGAPGMGADGLRTSASLSKASAAGMTARTLDRPTAATSAVTAKMAAALDQKTVVQLSADMAAAAEADAQAAAEKKAKKIVQINDERLRRLKAVRPFSAFFLEQLTADQTIVGKAYRSNWKQKTSGSISELAIAWVNTSQQPLPFFDPGKDHYQNGRKYRALCMFELYTVTPHPDAKIQEQRTRPQRDFVAAWDALVKRADETRRAELASVESWYGAALAKQDIAQPTDSASKGIPASLQKEIKKLARIEENMEIAPRPVGDVFSWDTGPRLRGESLDEYRDRKKFDEQLSSNEQLSVRWLILIGTGMILLTVFLVKVIK